jgi:hypothetical protein
VLYQLKQEFAKNKNEVGQTISSDKVFSDTELKQLEEQIADLSRYRQDVLNHTSQILKKEFMTHLVRMLVGR